MKYSINKLLRPKRGTKIPRCPEKKDVVLTQNEYLTITNMI